MVKQQSSSMNVDDIEKKALWITVVVNLIMAVAGWVTFMLTNSQAILLDGNFSFVLAIATIVALIISKNKHKKTSTFPFGSYVYEAAFVLSKGFLILGIIIMAFFQNTIKIIDFLQGQKSDPVELVPIYYYTAFILVITLLLLWFFSRQNKRTDNKSSMLLVEAESAKVDGVLTIATGLVFFLISFIAAGGKLDFLLYIGDAIIVIIMSLVMLATPLKIIRNAFIELGGGTLQNQQEKKKIETVIQQVVKEAFSFESYISKMGSGYLVVVYVDPQNTMTIDKFALIQKEIKERLKNSFPVVMVEISIKE